MTHEITAHAGSTSTGQRSVPPAHGIAAWRSVPQDFDTEYRPRRALFGAAGGPDEEAERDGAGALFCPPPGMPSPSEHWAAPLDSPIVGDLAATRHDQAASVALVARELDRLRAADARWVYLNSIPGGRKGSEIDHLVIGPGGVFAINAGRRPDTPTGTGGDIRCGCSEAQRAAELLTAATRISVRVQGLIVPASARRAPTKQPSNIVTIVNRDALVDHLRSQPPYLDAATRTRITGYARLSSTWSV